MLCPREYAAMIRSPNPPFHLRKALVSYALQHGIRQAQRTFSVSRNTVRKWLRRYKDNGLTGLQSRSTRPLRFPGKVSQAVENQVLEARRLSGFGAERLVEEFQLPCGVSAVRRILQEHNLTRKPRRKYQKKNDLREVKKRYMAFERLQMDVKHLCDQPFYWPQAQALGLPAYQFTIRDVRTGAKWISFASENASVYSELTAIRLLKHLKAFGVDISKTIVQSDNGPEFKGNQMKHDGREFAAVVQNLGAQHRFIPPRCPNANADVESAHSRIEAEFYAREVFTGLNNFLTKSLEYQMYWNIGRPNRWKNKMTPWEIIKTLAPQTKIETLLMPPLFLDTLLSRLSVPHAVGHNVPPSPVFRPISGMGRVRQIG